MQVAPAHIVGGVLEQQLNIAGIGRLTVESKMSEGRGAEQFAQLSHFHEVEARAAVVFGMVRIPGADGLDLVFFGAQNGFYL